MVNIARTRCNTIQAKTDVLPTSGFKDLLFLGKYTPKQEFSVVLLPNVTIKLDLSDP